jgi:hypothetical protein
MSNSFFDPDWTAKVTLPVKRVGERWEFFYGGDIPVREGTLGELTLSAEQITDDSFKHRVTQEAVVRILDEGTELRVALSDRGTFGGLQGDWPTPRPFAVPPGTTRFERIWLGPVKRKEGTLPLEEEMERGGLWLKLKGMERCELHGSTIQMPSGFAAPFAQSLNHALTLLSEKYETHRISHTGNVYARVFYQEPSGSWYPLDDLRQGVLADAERELLKSTWAEVERKLGWRPPPPSSSKKRK